MNIVRRTHRWIAGFIAIACLTSMPTPAFALRASNAGMEDNPTNRQLRATLAAENNTNPETWRLSDYPYGPQPAWMTEAEGHRFLRVALPDGQEVRLEWTSDGPPTHQADLMVPVVRRGQSLFTPARSDVAGKTIPESAFTHFGRPGAQNFVVFYPDGRVVLAETVNGLNPTFLAKARQTTAAEFMADRATPPARVTQRSTTGLEEKVPRLTPEETTARLRALLPTWPDLNDLTGADLSGMDLRGFHLANRVLARATLTDADLTDASLRNASLARANLRDADLTGADLRGASLGGANLRDTNLTGADLRRAQGLNPAAMVGVRWSAATQWPVGFMVSRIPAAGLEEPTTHDATPPDATMSAHLYSTSESTQSALHQMIYRAQETGVPAGVKAETFSIGDMRQPDAALPAGILLVDAARAERYAPLKAQGFAVVVYRQGMTLDQLLREAATNLGRPLPEGTSITIEGNGETLQLWV